MELIIVAFSYWLFTLSLSADGFSSTSSAPPSSPSSTDLYGRPYFGQTNTDVFVQEGGHAFFHCAVHNLGNSTVSQSDAKRL